MTFIRKTEKQLAFARDKGLILESVQLGGGQESISVGISINFQNFTINVPNKVIDSFKLGLTILSSLEGEVKQLVKIHKVRLKYSSATSFANQIKLLVENDMYY